MNLAHAGDALSALLDGELSPAAELEVQAHLAACGPCRAELAGVTDARAWVRALPPVEPPLGFFDRLVQPYRPPRRRAVVAALGAAAAVAAAVLGVAPARQDPVAPAVANLAEVHATSASVGGDPLGNLAPAGVRVTFRR